MRRLKEKVKTPEGVPRLFDLVHTENEKSKMAFFAVLGNTVVAKDLDQVRLSKLVKLTRLIDSSLYELNSELCVEMKVINLISYKHQEFSVDQVR